ncbi:MAG: type I pantothenate kinase [Thermaerobacter sp.]|nr:type I pantothenate kinase [Thermaerobacter sp.]
MSGREEDRTPFLTFSRSEWCRLRAATPLTLSSDDLVHLQGLNERLSLDEIEDVYLPLSRLLDLDIAAVHELQRAREIFLGSSTGRVPFVIGIAGSVAVGKSTTARILQALLARWPNHPRVDLVATDGFLHPNSVLTGRGILHRKGFPESYDQQGLVRFLSDLKSARTGLCVPAYSHLRYDIVPGEWQLVQNPDIVIVEGLNILQGGRRVRGSGQRLLVPDFLDFTLFVDAEEEIIRQWYVERFLTLRDTAFLNPQSYFHRYAELSDAAAVKMAETLWSEINSVNLRENIAPTRDRAQLVLRKGRGHRVQELKLRKV